MNQSINGSINQLMDQSIDQRINQSIDGSINQLMDQSINQWINQSIDGSINQFDIVCTYLPCNQAAVEMRTFRSLLRLPLVLTDTLF